MCVGIDEERMTFTVFEVQHVSVAEGDGEHSYLVLTRWHLNGPIPPAGDELQGATADYLASVIVDSTWEPLTQWWSVEDPLGADTMASLVEEVNNAIHEGAVRAPVAAVAEALGVPELPADILAGIVDKAIELPQDGLVSEFGEAVRIAGIGFGLATGNHLMTIASVESLVHDVATEKLGDLIDCVLSPGQDGGADVGLPERETPEEEVHQSFERNQEEEKEKEVPQPCDWWAGPEDVIPPPGDPAEIDSPELDLGWL